MSSVIDTGNYRFYVAYKQRINRFGAVLAHDGQLLGGVTLEEVKRVAIACGLPDFRYYPFPAVLFTIKQAAIPNITPLILIENASIEAIDAAVLQRPEVVRATADVIAMALQLTTLPAAPSYLLLAEAADDLQTAAAYAIPSAAIRDRALTLGRPTRRRPRPAGRAALAAIGRT